MSLAESICKLIKQREEFGAKRYGRPLCPHTDKRDFLQEAFEEWADQGFYLMAAIERRDAAMAKKRARDLKYSHSPKGKVRNKRRNDKPRTKEQHKWHMRRWRKLQSIQNAIR